MSRHLDLQPIARPFVFTRAILACGALAAIIQTLYSNGFRKTTARELRLRRRQHRAKGRAPVGWGCGAAAPRHQARCLYKWHGQDGARAVVLLQGVALQGRAAARRHRGHRGRLQLPRRVQGLHDRVLLRPQALVPRAERDLRDGRGPRGGAAPHAPRLLHRGRRRRRDGRGRRVVPAARALQLGRADLREAAAAARARGRRHRGRRRVARRPAVVADARVRHGLLRVLDALLARAPRGRRRGAGDVAALRGLVPRAEPRRARLGRAHLRDRAAPALGRRAAAPGRDDGGVGRRGLRAQARGRRRPQGAGQRPAAGAIFESV